MINTKPFMQALLIVFAGAAAALSGCVADKTVELNIAASGSLTDALTEAGNLYMENNDHVMILNNFAAAGDLQTQINKGGTADVFISAAPEYMDALEDEGLILTETRRNLLKNRLALIVPEKNTLDLAGFEDLTADRVSQIAMGDPAFVPAGIYGRRTLELLGISYTELRPKMILASNVRQVLSYVESGNVDAGIVFTSDTLRSGAVKVIALAPDQVNDMIVYPAAVVASSNYPAEALDFIDFLAGAEAESIFKKYGFIATGN